MDKIKQMTVYENGDANSYTIFQDKTWLMNIQMNGELTIGKQREIITAMLEALGENGTIKKRS